MQSLDAVLFDLDGVLVDACDWHYEALNKALEDMAYAPVEWSDHVDRFNGLPTRVKLSVLGINPEDAKDIEELKQIYTIQTIRDTAKTLPEKQLLLSTLRGHGIKIACVTNSIKQTASEMLLATGQRQYIDLLVTNEDVTKNKPHPDCYNFAIQALDVDPTRCLCVEDSPKGTAAARTSNARRVWEVQNATQVTVENLSAWLKEHP